MICDNCIQELIRAQALRPQWLRNYRMRSLYRSQREAGMTMTEAVAVVQQQYNHLSTSTVLRIVHTEDDSNERIP